MTIDDYSKDTRKQYPLIKMLVQIASKIKE